MKKILSLILICGLIFSLTACGEAETASQNSSVTAGTITQNQSTDTSITTTQASVQNNILKGWEGTYSTGDYVESIGNFTIEIDNNGNFKLNGKAYEVRADENRMTNGAPTIIFDCDGKEVAMYYDKEGKMIGCTYNSDSFQPYFLTDSVSSNSTGNEFNLFERDSDKDYFSPITDDYIYCIYKTEGDDQRAALTSYDSDGNIVQYVKRDIHEGLLTGLYIANDDDFIVGDTIYEDIGKLYGLDGHEGVVWSKKIYDILCLEGSGGAFMGIAPIESYYSSKEITSDDTKFENTYSLSDFENFSLATYATDDYKIETSEKISNDEYITNWDLYWDRETGYATVPVRIWGAYSYVETYVTCFNEYGQVVETVTIKMFDEPGMVTEYLKQGFGHFFDTTGVSADEQWVHETTFPSDRMADVKQLYEVITDTYLISRNEIDPDNNEEDYDNLERDWKQNGSIKPSDTNVTARYFSKPYLTEQQLAFGFGD